MQALVPAEVVSGHRSEIERNVRLPAEQAYEQILDAEQLAADGRRMRAIPSKRMFAIDIFSPRGVKEEKR